MGIRALSARRNLHLIFRSLSNQAEISIANLLSKNIFPSDLSKSISIFQSLGFSQNSLLSTIHTCPKTLDPEFLTKWFNCFSELGLSNGATFASTIQMILAQSARFKIEPEEFDLSLQQMKSVGFSAGTVIRVFEMLPAAFMSEGIHVGRRIEFLKKTAGIQKQEDLNSICYSFPEVLAFSIDGMLRPLFSELYELGFDRIEVRKLLIQEPRLLLGLQLGELSRCVNLLEGLKCRTPIKEKILAKGRLCAAVNVKIRIDLLCNHGLIRRDALKILHVEPRSILYSLEDLEKKIKFLQQQIGFSIDHLVEFPDYLGVNLEKQIIPRSQVVELLKSKDALEMAVELKHFVRLSRRKFYNFFVKPYPECEKIFGGLIRDARGNNEMMKLKHPTGFWKLFKPQKYSDSKEDVKNLKQFMETLV